MLPNSCKQVSIRDSVFFMRVGCKSDEVRIFGKMALKKEIVAMVVVFSDLFVSFLLFVMFAFLRSMQNTTA